MIEVFIIAVKVISLLFTVTVVVGIFTGAILIVTMAVGKAIILSDNYSNKENKEKV